MESDAEGTPLRLRNGSAWADLALMRRAWRIDQHWWRGDGIARMYYRVAPEDGAPLTLYRDLRTGNWYRQEYT